MPTETEVKVIKGCATCAELNSEQQCKCPGNKSKGKDNTNWAIHNCIRKGLQHWKAMEATDAPV